MVIIWDVVGICMVLLWESLQRNDGGTPQMCSAGSTATIPMKLICTYSSADY